MAGGGCNRVGTNPGLVLNKCVNNAYAVVGETITYTIFASNTSEITLSSVTIFDNLGEGLAFEVGSVKIDGVPDKLASIVTGVDIGQLLPKQRMIVRFRTKVISNKINPIINTSNGSFEFMFLGGPTEIGDAISNPVKVIPQIANIDVIKTSDKDFVVVGGIVTYTVKLKNTGTLESLNIIFKDLLQKEVQLIAGSFSLNGNVINGVNINQGINIGNIKVEEEVVIKYTVKIIKANCDLKIINEANVKFDYRLPNNRAGVAESEKTSASTTTVTIGINNFKQISIAENLIIPTQKPDVEEISEVIGEIEILKYHVIKTPILSSNEGQRLTGYKLVIHGVINEIIEYTACESEQSVHSAHYSIPFSTFIVLPENYCNSGNIEVEGVLEAMYYKEIDERTLFTNATILIKATGCSC